MVELNFLKNISSTVANIGKGNAEFKQAAAQQNSSISKFMKDVSKMFGSQTKTQGDINESLSGLSQSSVATSQNIQQNNSLLSQSISVQTQMLNELKEVSKNIATLMNNTTDGDGSPIGGQNDQGGFSEIMRTAMGAVSGLGLAISGPLLGEIRRLLGGFDDLIETVPGSGAYSDPTNTNEGTRAGPIIEGDDSLAPRNTLVEKDSPISNNYGGGVQEKQEELAGVRKLPLSPKLKSVLDQAAAAAGVEAVVYSGGQAPKGSGGPRTGSTRHDDGNAADLYLMKDGRKLADTNPEDRQIMAKFVSAAVQAGATGVGAGHGYMGPSNIHVGFGKQATWGGAPWIQSAASGIYNNADLSSESTGGGGGSETGGGGYGAMGMAGGGGIFDMLGPMTSDMSGILNMLGPAAGLGGSILGAMNMLAGAGFNGLLGMIPGLGGMGAMNMFGGGGQMSGGGGGSEGGGGGYSDTGGGGKLSVSQMTELAKQAGFTDEQAVIMGAIGAAESSGNPQAHNPNASTGDNSYGLWQINMLGKLEAERKQLFGIQDNEQLKDPKINAIAAKKIYDQQGFNAWSVYKSGAYRKYLGTANKTSQQQNSTEIPGEKDDASALSTLVEKGSYSVSPFEGYRAAASQFTNSQNDISMQLEPSMPQQADYIQNTAMESEVSKTSQSSMPTTQQAQSTEIPQRDQARVSSYSRQGSNLAKSQAWYERLSGGRMNYNNSMKLWPNVLA